MEKIRLIGKNYNFEGYGLMEHDGMQCVQMFQCFWEILHLTLQSSRVRQYIPPNHWHIATKLLWLLYLPPLEIPTSTEILYHKTLSKISRDVNFLMSFPCGLLVKPN